MKKKVFLLGGHDLEMQTIRELLEQQNALFYDKNLRWDNALLSQYANELIRYADKNTYEIYGIELIEKDITPPVNYYRIDHHNDYHHLPSSLEQTASLLKIPLTRELQLIAVNDRGYIPAMKEMGANDEEIRRIRLADRQAQGVTQTDEELAQEAITHKEVVDGIIVVYSGTNRFSPITDRLYPYDRLLIYTSDELIYYGEGKSQLVIHFQDEIRKGNLFHGGGDTGFIGTAHAAYTEQEIRNLKNTIVKLINP